MDVQHLISDEELQLEQLVMHSITSRYAGELEHWENPHTAEITYTPLNDIHDLLIELWDSYFTADTPAWFEQRLREDGAEREEWGPEAYCEEDLEWEREQRLRDEDYDEWCREQQIAHTNNA